MLRPLRQLFAHQSCSEQPRRLSKFPMARAPDSLLQAARRRFFKFGTGLVVGPRWGSGGFADVYPAIDRETGRVLALKRFKTLQVAHGSEPKARGICKRGIARVFVDHVRKRAPALMPAWATSGNVAFKLRNQSLDCDD
jgi:hypothetical protein